MRGAVRGAPADRLTCGLLREEVLLMESVSSERAVRGAPADRLTCRLLREKVLNPDGAADRDVVGWSG